MIQTKILVVSLLALMLVSATMALKVDHAKASHAQKDDNKNPVTKVENSTDGQSCTKDFCIEKFALMEDPFNPACDENATCWRTWYGFPNCTDDDKKCWQTSVGYPKDCAQDDYDCWLKFYGYAQCEDVQCLKEYLNYTCKYDDLECWKSKTWARDCKWNDWDCWIKNSFMEFLCDDKKGYDCVSFYYSNPCKQDDQKCWRKTLGLPEVECQKDVECLKDFYYLPNCKDDDFKCWQKLYFGPNCTKGDMECLKNYFWIPDCKKQNDQIQCYKKWLGYPDCKADDGKCWKDFDDLKKDFITLYMKVEGDLDHKGSNKINKQAHRMSQINMSMGKIMEHKRKVMAQSHKLNRQFHMKRAGLIQ